MESSFFVKFCARLSSSWIRFCCLCKTRRCFLVLYAWLRTVLMDPHCSWQPGIIIIIIIIIIVIVTMNINIEGALISLLKSKSGFSIRKRIFRFFTKIQKRITDPNDPQRRWILWIISKTGYFGYMIRSVSLLRIRKEWTLPAVTRNNFNTYWTAFWQDGLPIRSFLNRSRELNDGFYPFYRGGKIAIQKGPALFQLQGKSATQLRRHVLQDVIFPIHILFQDSSSFGPSKAVS